MKRWFAAAVSINCLLLIGIAAAFLFNFVHYIDSSSKLSIEYLMVARWLALLSFPVPILGLGVVWAGRAIVPKWLSYLSIILSFSVIGCYYMAFSLEYH